MMAFAFVIEVTIHKLTVLQVGLLFNCYILYLVSTDGHVNMLKKSAANSTKHSVIHPCDLQYIIFLCFLMLIQYIEEQNKIKTNVYLERYYFVKSHIVLTVYFLKPPPYISNTLSYQLENESRKFIFIYQGTKTLKKKILKKVKSCVNEGTLPLNISPSLLELVPINGGWGKWTSWTTCTKSCDMGIQHRYRFCNRPAAKYDGDNCGEDGVEIQACNPQKCVGE